MRKVLISTLGDTPPVVTEALDKLKADGISIDEVILFRTKDVDAKASAELLISYIPQRYPETATYNIVTEAYTDIDSDAAVVDFMRQACEQLKMLRKQGCEIYVSIAGGRKSMSALMTLAVQLYGATRLFHVLLDDLDLEGQGKISELRFHPDPERVLHPSIEHIRLVHLPFVGLFPWLKDLLSGMQGQPVSREIKTLLEVNGLVGADGIATSMGKLVHEILEDVETLPDPCPHPSEVHISASEPRYRDHLNRLIDRLRPLGWIRRIQGIPWRQGEPKTKVREAGIIEVYISTGGPSIGLRLETTAQTLAQTERVKREVDRRLGW